MKKRKFCKFSKGQSFQKWKRKKFFKNQYLQDQQSNPTGNIQVIEKINHLLNVDQFSSSDEENDNPVIPSISSKNLEYFEESDLKTSVPSLEPEECDFEIDRACGEFGFCALKEDQRRTIKRILLHKTTVLVAPTNYGKSICYQIPSLIYYRRFKALTLVISPLISLIQDQIKSLPHFIKATTLHSSLGKEKRDNIIYRVSQRDFSILYVAPEALIYGGPNLFDNFPPISFVCIDEIHCLSSWSHNFRPAYLSVTNLLIRQMGTPCYLGLTATINHEDLRDITNKLGIEKEKEESIIGHTSLSENINMNVLYVGNKLNSLLEIVENSLNNVNYTMLIFCRQRSTTEMVSSFLRTKLRGIVNSNSIECYHAGLSSKNRENIQIKFKKDFVQFLICTSAFGMGLNKQNIRYIVHFDVPSSIEQFVQEIGRGGRDGVGYESFLFMDENTFSEINRIKASVYENSIDIKKISLLLGHLVFNGCNMQNQSHHHMIGIDKTSIIQELDIKLEAVETIIHFIENPFMELANYFETSSFLILKDIIKHKKRFKNVILEYQCQKIIIKVSCLDSPQLNDKICIDVYHYLELHKKQLICAIDNMFQAFYTASKNGGSLVLKNFIENYFNSDLKEIKISSSDNIILPR
ncbi:hypothetical protein MXB_3361 [Myxobolus squamalis]|nr:hypothetical protein MXB_3361 [Myxobolus squamalis]